MKCLLFLTFLSVLQLKSASEWGTPEERRWLLEQYFCSSGSPQSGDDILRSQWQQNPTGPVAVELLRRIDRTTNCIGWTQWGCTVTGVGVDFAGSALFFMGQHAALGLSCMACGMCTAGLCLSSRCDIEVDRATYEPPRFRSLCRDTRDQDTAQLIQPSVLMTVCVRCTGRLYARELQANPPVQQMSDAQGR